MSRIAILVGGLIMAAAFSSDAAAQSPVRFWITIHHSDWADRPRQVNTFEVELSDMNKVTRLCSSGVGLKKTAEHIRNTNIEIKGYIEGAACVRDAAGNIKTAAGAPSPGSN